MDAPSSQWRSTATMLTSVPFSTNDADADAARTTRSAGVRTLDGGAPSRPSAATDDDPADAP